MNPSGKTILTLVLRSRSNVMRFSKRIPRENKCLVCIWQHLGTNSPVPQNVKCTSESRMQMAGCTMVFQNPSIVLKRQIFLKTSKRGQWAKVLVSEVGKSFLHFCWSVCLCTDYGIPAMLCKLLKERGWKGIGSPVQNVSVHTTVPRAGGQVRWVRAGTRKDLIYGQSWLIGQVGDGVSNYLNWHLLLPSINGYRT